MIYLGDFPTGQTIYIPWNTFDSNDPSASVTMTGLATSDIKIYKDGGVTQRSSTAGFTLLDTDGTDFDGITGIHGISIDTSDDTDSGFYAAGSDYWVVIDSVTVDGATISFVAAIFSIDNRGLYRIPSDTIAFTIQASPSPTTTAFGTGITWGDTDQVKDRFIIFDEDTTTTALQGQAKKITASTTAGVLTVDTLTSAPSSGDTGIIF